MDEINTSLIVFGRGEVINTSFDRPISVAGKSIGVKSVGFPQINPLVKYKFRVLDSEDVVHTLKLPSKEWETSDQIMEAMFDEMNNLFDKLGLDGQVKFEGRTRRRIDNLYDKLGLGDQEEFYFGDEVPEVIEKPLFYKNVGNDLLTVIYYVSSGLRIKDDSYPPPNDSVFSLLKSRYSRSNDDQFAYANHVLKQPEDPALETTVPVFLICDAIKPSYTGAVKRRILDVVHVPRSKTHRTYFTNTAIQFHEFSVDKVLHLNFYFQYLDGTVLNFAGPVVLHLMIK